MCACVSVLAEPLTANDEIARLAISKDVPHLRSSQLKKIHGALKKASVDVLCGQST